MSLLVFSLEHLLEMSGKDRGECMLVSDVCIPATKTPEERNFGVWEGFMSNRVSACQSGVVQCVAPEV